MLPSSERERLSRVAQSARDRVAARVTNYVETAWVGLGTWRDADVARFVELVAPVVESGQLAIAEVTDAYLARILELDGASLIDAAGLRGVPTTDVYQRPAVTMRTALSKGSTFDDALDQSVTRLRSLAQTDMQLAHTNQARATLAIGPSGTGFKRVLSGRENCALCVIASTQRYTREDLLPIHPGCDCGVEPLGPGEGAQQVIDPALLESTHEQVARFTGQGQDRGARDLGLGKATADERPVSDYTELVVTREHGEYGPTLAWRDDKFTTLAAN